MNGRAVVVALLLSCAALVAPVSVGGADGPGDGERTLEVVPWLLDVATFVVDGALTANDYAERPALSILPVEVHQVLMGSVPEGVLHLNTLGHWQWPGHPPSAGTHVVAWGGCEEDGSCYGNLVVVDERGGLVPGEILSEYPLPRMVLDGREVRAPDSYARLLRDLGSRVRESAAGWLTSGSGIALVEVDQVHGATCHVHLIATVAGDAAPGPHVVVIHPAYAPGTIMLAPGDQFLVPTFRTNRDTLVAPIQIRDHSLLRGSWVRAFGMDVQEAGRAIRFDSTGGHLPPTHHKEEGVR